MDDGMGPSTVPTQSPSPMHKLTTPTSQPFQIMLGAYPIPYMFPFLSPMAGWNAWPGASPFPITLTTQSMIYKPSSLKRSHEALLVSPSLYHSTSPYGIQTLLSWVMQTPPHSLFYQGGSSSQHPQSEQPQPSPEQPRRNLARNRHPPPCGHDSDLHVP
ncbi:hypothetical protein PVK06_023545 [Gossypium arboreum]|uniref:Uncharacterized protein n=1 Tax=Gossypium arboreum TaxID=29729 RepID=A0ABR0PBF4_GOSAR|nr:hypothetical protein PVK06_023545 [Gossypium arboreum]